MDITKILSNMKGKILDATNFDLLKSAYDLQSENITQLKENNLLLQDKVERLEKENKSLNRSLTKLKGQIPSPSDPSCLSNLSDVARDILKLYLSRDLTYMFNTDMASLLPYSQIQIEAAVDELMKANILQSGIAVIDKGYSYYLTDSGTKYLANGLLS